MAFPVVSVIISCYNKGVYLRDAIDRIKQQTFANWELILIDDCSSDDTLQILKAVSLLDQRILYFSNNVNKGANYCRNKGIRNARGEYVIFLDADDLLSYDCLEKRLQFIRQYPELHAAVFPMQVFRNHIGDSKYSWVPKKKNALKRFLSHNLPWTIMQPIWKVSFIREIGGFDEDFSRLQDVELHTRALMTEGFDFKTVSGNCDSFYRINDQRKNYLPYDFLLRTCHSAVLYFNKFYDECLNRRCERLLSGTIYHAYYAALQHCRNGKISRTELGFLQDVLLNDTITNALSRGQKIVFKTSKTYHLRFMRVPGINWLLMKFLLI